MRPAVLYIPYDAYSRGGDGNITTFAQFGEGELLSETRGDTEICNEYDDD